MPAVYGSGDDPQFYMLYSKSPHQLRDRNAESICKFLDGSQFRLMLSVFQVGQKHATKARFNGQFYEFPAPLSAQPAYSLSELPFDVICHPLSMNVLFRLRVASTLHAELMRYTMASPRLTSRERADVYRLIFLLNRSFDFIVQHLHALQKTRLLNSKAAKLFPDFTQELQSEINQEFLENLHQSELDDWGEYGKAREKYEKHLRDPDDVFIHAEERRKQLAKQRKKSKRRG